MRKPQIPDQQRNALTLFIVLVVTLSAELFVFNLAHWRTISHGNVSVGAASLGSGLRQSDTPGVYTITDADNAWIDFPVTTPDRQKPLLDSIRIVPPDDTQHDEIPPTTHYQLSTRNEAGDWVNISYSAWRNQLTENLAYCADSPATQYMLIPNRTTDAIRISFTDGVGATVPISSIAPNVTVPLTICWQRILAILLIAALVLMFRPASPLYAVTVDLRNVRQRIGIIVNVSVLCLLFVALCCISGDITHAYASRSYNATFSHWTDLNQYQQLADAFLHGRLNLDLPVDPQLAAMDNPYDFYQRQQLGESGATIFWDHAFYDGKYYVYFGALPALILFAPFQALTGHWLPSPVAVMVFGVIFICAISALLTTLCATRFRGRIPYGTLLLSVNLTVLGCGIVYYGFQPDFYAIPFISSLAFTALGLLLWCTARTSSGKLSTARIIGGSAFIACNLGCRPQFLVACLLAFPLFWNEIVHTRELFSRQSIGRTVGAFVPFAIAAIPWMAYNAARFGSPFDVGSAYNLTGYDATRLRPALIAFPAMLFIQLFQPPMVNTEFPFVHAINNAIPVPCEPSLGGYFVIVPFAALGFLLVALRQRLKAIHVFGLAVILATTATLMVLFDIGLAGTTNRYHGDFAWLCMLLAVVVLYALETRHGPSAYDGPTVARTVFRTVLLAMLLWSLFIYVTGCFSPERYDPLIDLNPNLYYTVKSWFLGFYAI